MKLKQLNLLIIFISFTNYPKAQQILTFPIVKEPQHFNWSLIEKKVPRATITKFINKTPGYFRPYRHPEEYSENIDSLYRCLHFMDVNNDGLDDVIFNGRSSGEANLIEVFINTGNNYKEVFEDTQGIVKIDWENKKISKLYTVDWGCCDDYRVLNKIFTVTYDERNNPGVKQIYQSANIYGASMPDSLFDTPVRFEVLNDHYKLRSEPLIDDSTIEHWNADSAAEVSAVNYGKGYGNCIGLLPEYARGTAIGWKTDLTGRIWWYVEIDVQYALANNAFDYGDSKFSTKSIGWLSSRFVRKLP